MAAKHVYSADQEGVTGAGWTKGFTAVPTNIIRYAEVLLWRAEIAARENDLSLALQYVNIVRARSANPAQFVKNEDGTNAANYLLGLYPSFPSQAYAIEAVEFEYRLETALEGHRFFDLVRRNRAVDVLTEYVRDEIQRTYLANVSSFPPRSIYFPIPTNIISLSGGSLQQNDGY